MRSFSGPQVSLYKILFLFKALLQESLIRLLPLPPTQPTLLQYYCTTIAQYTLSHRPPFCMPCTIQYWRWQYRVKANPQACVTSCRRFAARYLEKKTRRDFEFCSRTPLPVSPG